MNNQVEFGGLLSGLSLPGILPFSSCSCPVLDLFVHGPERRQLFHQHHQLACTALPGPKTADTGSSLPITSLFIHLLPTQIHLLLVILPCFHFM